LRRRNGRRKRERRDLAHGLAAPGESDVSKWQLITCLDPNPFIYLHLPSHTLSHFIEAHSYYHNRHVSVPSFISLGDLTLTHRWIADTPTERPKPVRKSTLDPDTVDKLDKAISHRPEKQELLEKNILKGSYPFV
jgi:hypothetical protein